MQKYTFLLEIQAAKKNILYHLFFNSVKYTKIRRFYPFVNYNSPPAAVVTFMIKPIPIYKAYIIFDALSNKKHKTQTA